MRPPATAGVSFRSLSSSARAAAPPKPKSQLTAAARKYGKNKATGTEEEGGAGSGSGNVLDDLRAPKLDLGHLKPFHPEVLTPKAVGQVFAFPNPTMAAFKAYSIPPLIEKEFAFTPRPSTVVRSVTLKAIDLLDSTKTGPSRNSRYVLDGPAGSGKSVLMLQTVSYAHSTGWIVLYLPSATPLVDSSTPHAYSPSLRLFQQPALSSTLLAKFFAANRHAFKLVRTTKPWAIGGAALAPGKALEELAHLGRDERSACAALEAVFEELAEQTQFPVLLALDDAQSLLATSSYVDPSYQPLESHSLSVPRLLLSYVSGLHSFKSGSVLLAPSCLSKRKSPALSRFLKAPAEAPADNDVYSQTLSGARVLAVPPRLERREAVGVVQLVQSWRGLREPVSDQGFLEQYVAADGNVREFSRGLERSAQL